MFSSQQQNVDVSRCTSDSRQWKQSTCCRSDRCEIALFHQTLPSLPVNNQQTNDKLHCTAKLDSFKAEFLKRRISYLYDEETSPVAIITLYLSWNVDTRALHGYFNVNVLHIQVFVMLNSWLAASFWQWLQHSTTTPCSEKKVIYLFFSTFLSFFYKYYETFKQWHKRRAACVSARGGHLEHML